jgi:hypothetical protein
MCECVNPSIPEWRTLVFSTKMFLTRASVAFRCSPGRSIVIHLFILLLLLFYNSSSVIKYYP